MIIPNIQQLIDTHIYESLAARYGPNAAGDNWQAKEGEQENEKNRYAIMREYRTVQPDDVVELVRGRTASNLGAIIVGNTRLVNTPLDLMGKKYGVRYETVVYTACMNYRQSQIGGERLVYKINADFLGAMMGAPFTIDRVSVPFVIQSFDSEFANNEMDAQRLLAIIPTSTFRATNK